MGNGASQNKLRKEASKPVDASDVETVEDAKKEIVRLRTMIKEESDSISESKTGEVAQSADEDKCGNPIDAELNPEVEDKKKIEAQPASFPEPLDRVECADADSDAKADDNAGAGDDDDDEVTSPSTTSGVHNTAGSSDETPVDSSDETPVDTATEGSPHSGDQENEKKCDINDVEVNEPKIAQTTGLANEETPIKVEGECARDAVKEAIDSTKSSNDADKPLVADSDANALEGEVGEAPVISSANPTIIQLKENPVVDDEGCGGADATAPGVPVAAA